MATEIMQLPVQDEPSLTQDSAETTTAPANEAALTEPAKASPHLEHERRLLAVRDINAKIGDLEGNISKLTAAFGQSQETLSTTLMELQRRNVRMTSDLITVITRVEQSSKEHHQATAELETRLTGNMTALQGQLKSAEGAMASQQARLDRLESTQELLQKLHDRLSTQASQHAEALAQHDERLEEQHEQLAQYYRELNKLASDTGEQLQINRTHIQGLNALHREQKHALEGLGEDVGLLADRTQQLETQLQGLEANVVEHRRHTHGRFRKVGMSLGVLTIVVFTTMAYLQLHPNRVPAAVKAQLSALSSAVEHQEAAQSALDDSIKGVQEHLTSLDASVSAQTAKIDAMTKSIEHASATIQRMQKSETIMKKKMEGLQAQVNAGQATAPAKTSQP